MSLPELGATFLIGMAATLAPCVFPLYPGFLAYLSSNSQRLGKSRSRYLLGLLVLLGVLTMMLLIGLVVASLGIAIGSVLVIASPLVDIMLFSLGVLLLLNFNPFLKLAQVRMPLLSNPLLSAYVYGLLFGPVVLPCTGPIVVGVFALSFSVSQFMDKMVLFFVFGLGFGLPLLLISFVGEIKGNWLARFFAARHAWVNRLSGSILVLLSIWDFYINLPALRLYF
ncbi:MAG: hypothetical protein HY673_05285 [Chloroflexi bacterium]|nr:hypothetical protein [Chloroflexota bacterium]